MTIRTKICIVGVTEPDSVGGLAGYQRWLSSQLEKNGYDVSSLSLLPRQSARAIAAYPNTATGLRMLDPIAQRLFRSLASRPSLHLLAERFACTYSKELARLFDSLQPTLIHFLGTGWLMVGFPLRKIANRANAKFSVLPAVHAKSWGDDRIDLRLYNSADFVFCLSNHEASHLRALGHSRSNLTVCGLPPLCSINGNASRIRDKLGLHKEPIVFFLGRRDQGKGYYALLEAWSRVTQVFPTAQLLIAGPGERISNTPNVHDLGCVDESTKADAYSACNVFCLPSAHESFGIVYLEAWSYGKPVICGEAPACRELITNNWNGLHSTRCVEELAMAITKLLGSPSMQIELGEKGKETILGKYSADSVVRCHLNAWMLHAGSHT